MEQRSKRIATYACLKFLQREETRRVWEEFSESYYPSFLLFYRDSEKSHLAFCFAATVISSQISPSFLVISALCVTHAYLCLHSLSPFSPPSKLYFHRPLLRLVFNTFLYRGSKFGIQSHNCTSFDQNVFSGTQLSL